MIADKMYILKENNLKDIGYFCPASLLNVEGKILFVDFGVKIN